MIRNLFTLSLALLAAFGMYTMGTDAAGRVPGPVGGLLPGVEGSHAPVIVPAFVNYQGRLVDTTTGNPLPDGSYPVRFSIHTGVTAGTEVWFETKNVTTQDGVFSTLLGSGAPLPATAFEGPLRFLQVQVGTDGSLPRQQFTTTPYAFFSGGAALANNAEQLGGLNPAQFLRADVAATQGSNLTVAGNFATNQATTLGNGVGSDPVVVNDSLTVNGGTQLGDALSDTTIITGPVDTLADVTIGGDLVVDGNNIDNGADVGDLRIDATEGNTSSILLGGSTSQSDDVQIVDGGLCVGNAGCNSVPTDGSLQVDGGGAFRSQTTFDSDIIVGNDPAFDSTAHIVLGGDSSRALRHDANDIASPDLEIRGFLATEMSGSLCVANFTSDLDSGGGVCESAINARVGVIVADGAIESNAFDLAERFAAIDSDLIAGDLVMFGESGARVQRSDGTPYDARIAGIVSGDPGLVLGWAKDGDVPVALQGRVPLNVTLENGPIAPGDYLTSSSTPGKAMRATEPGPVAGIALEAYDGDGDAQVLTFVATGDRNVGALVERIDGLERQIAQGGGSGESDAGGATAVAAREGGAASPWMTMLVIGALGAALSATAAAGVSRRRLPS